MLLKLMEEEKPTHILVAFDAGKVTFRHEDINEYKGGRAENAAGTVGAVSVLKELLSAFGIAQFELDGYEADDIIGTLTRMAEERGHARRWSSPATKTCCSWPPNA